jgi:hypothetical protein
MEIFTMMREKKITYQINGSTVTESYDELVAFTSAVDRKFCVFDVQGERKYIILVNGSLVASGTESKITRGIIYHLDGMYITFSDGNVKLLTWDGIWYDKSVPLILQ